MMDIGEVIGRIVVGTLFLGYGISVLVRQQTSIGWGGGRSGGGPLFVIDLQGPAATVSSIFTIIGSLLFVIPSLLTIITGAVSEDLAGWSPFFGGFVIFSGMILGAIVQAAIATGERIRKEREKSAGQNDVKSL